MALRLLKKTLPGIPNYEFLGKINEGGMSSVYKATHVPTGKTVAIKVIKDRKKHDEELRKRFEQEFQSAKKLLHPNIVQVLEFYQEEDTACLIMEYIEGLDLYERVLKKGALPQQRAVAIITQLAQALNYAHSHGIIHRDVKPQNILLKRNGQPKLTDFGLVKDVMNNLMLTDPLSLLGTPHFMAPEQYEDARSVDARSDIYSLAATFYCIVTGTLPFQSDSPMETIRKQALNELVPPRKLLPSLSEHLDDAIVRAMNPDPAQRPATVLDFVKGLCPRDEQRIEQEKRKQVARDPKQTGRPEDRRASVRFECVMGTACASKTSFHDNGATDENWPATIQDISAGGVSLSLGRRFETGTGLMVELPLKSGRSSRTVEARVVYVKEVGEGNWLVGCTFPDPLADRDLRSLL